MKSAAGIDHNFIRVGEILLTTEFAGWDRRSRSREHLYGTGIYVRPACAAYSLVCAHLPGQIIAAFGVDRVLLGIGSICYDTPQRQIKAFRRFWVPDQLVKKHHYQSLTGEVKELTLGSNVARIFSVDVSAELYAVSKDYLGRVRWSYFEAGTEPSHRMYGLITY